MPFNGVKTGGLGFEYRWQNYLRTLCDYRTKFGDLFNTTRSMAALTRDYDTNTIYLMFESRDSVFVFVFPLSP